MSFLMPFYIAGLLGVSLPILFHLIRRMPRGKMPFSTLMFLKASPPRLTRRSRLENILLLLLRAAALILICLAFARPFFREAASLDVDDASTRRIALLLDTSASMRRGGLWQQAQKHVGEVLGDLRPGDRVALFAFDDTVRTVVGFDDTGDGRAEPQAELIRKNLKALSPRWGSTQLGAALVTVADALTVATETGATTGTVARREIVLVSDLQDGSRLEALQSYEWPKDVHVTLRGTAVSQPSNAAVQVLASTAPETTTNEVRVRITNSADSAAEQFQLRWAGKQGALPTSEALSVYVPPGESRVLRIPLPPRSTSRPGHVDRLTLSGDQHDFDNTFFIAPPWREEVEVRYLGEGDRAERGTADSGDVPRSLRYYVERAFASAPRRDVRLVDLEPGEPLAENSPILQLVIATAPLPEARTAELRRFMRSGGTVLYVLRDKAATATLSQLMGRTAGLRIEEAKVADYAMLGRVDVSHPLFSPFKGARFSDFTRVHFWKYRRVDLAGAAVEDGPLNVRVLASFDSADTNRADPALFEQPVGRGRLLAWTSGWAPPDSQLALSTKFVPLMVRLLENTSDSDAERAYYEVNETVALASAWRASSQLSVRKPDGSEVKPPRDTRTFDGADQPGVYRVQYSQRAGTKDGGRNGKEKKAPGGSDDRGEVSASRSGRPFAVNLTVAESHTAVLPHTELERRGVVFAAPTIESERQRQMRNVELESRQKLWRWLLALAVVVLILETWLAGRVARAPLAQAEITS